MFSRLAAVLIALVLVAATGMARSVSYLCSMDGQVRSACCCKQHDEQESADSPKVERPGCCEVRVSEATQAPATTKDGLQNEELPVPLALATIAPTINAPRKGIRDVVPGIGARSPPLRVGPPIFVWNCSYLI